MLDDEDIIMFLLLSTGAYFLLNHTRHRRFKTRPLNQNRKRLNVYDNLLLFMKNNDRDQFFKYTRMSPEMFDYLLDLIKPFIQKDVTKCPIEPGQRLAITLHYLSEGCSMQELAWNNYIGKSTVHCIIKETCEVLWNVLQPKVLPEPTVDDLAKISDGFLKRWNMPNCIGAVDGKYVVIQAPQYSGTMFFSYKQSFSIILMAVCDAYYKFVYVDIGCEGSNHDSNAFSNSGFGNSLLHNLLPIPNSKCLPGTNIMLPHFFVADQAFPLHKNIMRPYPGTYLSEKKNVFNIRLSRARRTIENTFGILAQRWRRLRNPIIANAELCDKIVLACVVLHNFIQKGEEDLPISERRYCPTGLADSVNEYGEIVEGTWRNTIQPLRSVGRLGANNTTEAVKRNRDNLAEYFVSPFGAIKHQLEQVYRGGLPANYNQHLL